MITFYDAATTVTVLIAVLLFIVSIFLLFKFRVAPAVSAIWFLSVVIFPILGPIGLLIYLAQRQKHSDNL